MKPIIDRSGKVIGFENELPNRKQLFNNQSQLLAWYDTNSKMTFKKDGSYVGRGDQTMRCLPED